MFVHTIEIFVPTKHGKSLTDVSYTINDEDGASSDEDDVAKTSSSDAELARKLAKEQANEPEGIRASSRLASNYAAMQDVRLVQKYAPYASSIIK